MGIFSFITDIFKPAANLVDELNTSEEEKLELRNALAKIEADVTIKHMELQAKLSESVAAVAAAEAQSEGWFVRNYRPMIITCMFLLIMGESFGLLKTELPEMFWQIFAAAFGVMSVTPGLAKAGAGLLKGLPEAVKGLLKKKG